MMYSDAKEGVESGGEEHPNSNIGTQDLVKECVLRVTIQENQPPPGYLLKPNVIIAMIASVTAYVPKDIVLLNDREAMVEFEGEVPIEILNEQLSMLRKWMGILDVRVQCCWPMHGQTRIAQESKGIEGGAIRTLGSPHSSSKTLISLEVQMNVLEQLVTGFWGNLKRKWPESKPWPFPSWIRIQVLKCQGMERWLLKHGDMRWSPYVLAMRNSVVK